MTAIELVGELTKDFDVKDLEFTTTEEKYGLKQIILRLRATKDAPLAKPQEPEKPL